MSEAFVLIPLESPKLKPKREKRKPGAVLDLAKASVSEWRLEPHVCRLCLGRVISTKPKDGDRVYRCTNCGAMGAAANPRIICACGMMIGTKNAGIRCVVNDMPTPENPSEILAKEVK